MQVVCKHDGSPRRVVDLSRLNKQCKREAHHSESPFHVVRRIPRNSWKTVTDAWQGFYLIPLRESDRHLTVFSTLFGLYQYKRAVQGYLSSGDCFNKIVVTTQFYVISNVRKEYRSTRVRRYSPL